MNLNYEVKEVRYVLENFDFVKMRLLMLGLLWESQG